MSAGHSIEALYERESTRILAMCRAILGDRGDAEDAMQETFARVAGKLDGLRGDPAAYLVVTARNVCRDELRRHRRLRDARHQWPADRAPDDTAVDRSLLRLAWHNLTQAERALLAGVANGLSLGEMARTSGVSADAAAQRISRARRRIRRLVAAPALMLGPAVVAAGRPLRRLGSLPADVAGALAGRGHEAEPVAGPLIVGLIAGMLAGPLGVAPGGGPPSPPPFQTPQAAAATPSSASPSSRATMPRPLALAHAMPVPQAPSAPSAPPLPDDHLFDGAQITSFTASPSYAQDRTVYASGRCVVPGCSTLYRSGDGGRSWTALGGAGLDGARVLLPPDYQVNSVLFAAGPGTGLLRSGDGGASFRVVTPPINGNAVMDPSSPPGDARVVMQLQGTAALAVYRDADRSAVPVTGLPPDVANVTALFTAPGASAVYVSITELVGGGSLYACTGAATCTRTGPGLTGVPVLAPSFVLDHTLFNLQTGVVHIARLDGGDAGTIATGDTTAVAVVPAADYARSGRVDVVVRRTPLAPASVLAMVHYVVGQAGAPVVQGGFTTAMDLSTAMRLPDGRVLVATALAAQRYGVRCSADDGATFTAAC